jgi:hypothetical protein
MRRLAVVAVVLAFCPPASAQPEPGFRLSQQLTPRASRLAGVPSSVYCANDPRSWARFAERRGLGALASEVYGMTAISARRMFLAPRICTPLVNHLRGRPVPLPPLADAIFTFVHESAHLNGIVGECAADHWAVAQLERVARTEFGIRKAARLRTLVRLARARSGYLATC